MPGFAARYAIVLSLAGLAVAPIAGQSTIRLGNELQVNTYTPGYQANPDVGLDGDGDFVVVWSSSSQDGSNYGIFARRFSASGSPQASEFQVNTFTANYQTFPAVALDGDGDFVVAWSSLLQDGDDYGIFARRFNAAGSPQATEFQVNVHTVGAQGESAVALDGDGDFVVVWESFNQDGSAYGIFARRFNAAGVAQASEFRVNTYTNDDQREASVGIDIDGDFVIAWRDDGLDGHGSGVFARRFDAAGIAQAVEFQVNTYTNAYESDPAVAVNAGGDFLIAWSDDEQDGSDSGIFARRFDAAGVAQATELQVNSFTPGSQRVPAAGIDGDGGFVVTWQSNAQDGSSDGIFSRRFSASGTPQAAELQVNTFTEYLQRSSTVAMNAGGDFVVAWRSANQDGSDEGVFAQRFASLAVLDIDGDGETAALTDGLLVLRFLFGFTGSTLVGGAVDVVACTRCDAGTIAAYLETLI